MKHQTVWWLDAFVFLMKQFHLPSPENNFLGLLIINVPPYHLIACFPDYLSAWSLDTLLPMCLFPFLV